MDEKLCCTSCITPLLASGPPGPLLKLITLQDRGGLTYPCDKFIGIIKQIANIAIKLLPYLGTNKTCQRFIDLILPALKKNPLFVCSSHKEEACLLIITKAVKPILCNICTTKSDAIKNIMPQN